MTLPEGPGWEWNPGATFVTAFNNAQENKRANEKMAMEQQLSEILFPAKKAQAEFTIKQLAYESERMENSYKLLNEETDERRRLLRESRSGGSGASVAQSSQPSRYGGGVATLLQNYMQGGSTPASGGRKVLGDGHTGD